MSLKTVRDAAFDQFHELLKSAPLHDVTVIPIDANVTVSSLLSPAEYKLCLS